MSKFHSLFSGSKGNASLLTFGKGSLLIDAGMSCKQLMCAISARDIPPVSIGGVLITHAHIDHIRGLRVFCKNTGVKVYASADTLSTLLRDGHITEQYFGGILDENVQNIGGFGVKAFPTDHDEKGSCGFRIFTPDERSCAVCTDLGHVTDAVHSATQGSDLVLLESNYDPAMLKNGSYPAHLKARISSNSGHLSNRASADEAFRLIGSGTTRLILGHLSEENNTPYLAEKATRDRLDDTYNCGSDYLLYIASRCGLKETVIF